MTRTVAALSVAILTFGIGESWAQPGAKTPRRQLSQLDAMMQMARELAAEQESPESARAAKQITAPSTSASGATLVDAPSFTQLVGLAFQNDLIAASNGTLTFSLNVYALKALANPSIEMLQENYGDPSNVRLRKLGGSVSMGGKGQEFDRDGDGKKDAAVEAKNLTDTLSLELKWRFWGNRDRRERTSLDAFKKAMRPSDDALSAVVVKLSQRIGALLQRHDASAKKPIIEKCADGQSDCIYDDRLQELYELVKAAFPSELVELNEALKVWQAARKAAVRAIDRQAMWSVVLTGTDQEPDFGPNKIGGALRGIMATGAWDHTINVDYVKSDWRQYGPKGYTAKFGYATSRLLSNDLDADDAVKVTFEVAAEKYHNVPGAKHDRLAKAAIRFDFPLTDTMKVPVSINYASHTDLLTDQHLLTSHVGIAWDFSGLSKKKKE